MTKAEALEIVDEAEGHVAAMVGRYLAGVEDRAAVAQGLEALLAGLPDELEGALCEPPVLIYSLTLSPEASQAVEAMAQAGLPE